jgi:aryl-alcohol dehydrogenase-like predicted oxidoreductase
LDVLGVAKELAAEKGLKVPQLALAWLLGKP